MSDAGKLIAPCRKRQHIGEGLSPNNPSESRPSKRLKSSTRLHSAAFYDSLEKVWLTRRALKELDRRTSQTSSPERSALIPQHVHQQDTWKRIQRFARHGGPELCDLRGYPAPPDINPTHMMSSSRSSAGRRTQSTRLTSDSTSKTSNKSSAYDANFEQILVEHHIYPEGYDYSDDRATPEPSNLDEIRQKLAQPRSSLSPSVLPDSAFRDFKRANNQAISEGKLMRTVFPTIYGTANIPNEGDLVFTQLESITNGVTVNAKPDFYDGARPEDIAKQVREDLKSYIIPSSHQHAPAAPNFFTEAKPPKGLTDVAKRQACYDGALGARGMHKLQSYQGKPVYDDIAYTITSKYHDGTLKMYTTHPTAGPGNSTEYHMTQIDTWGLTGNPDGFRWGATAFRNARDWAREKREVIISAANKKERSTIAEPSALELSKYSAVTHLQADDPEEDFRHYTHGGYDSECSNLASDSEDSGSSKGEVGLGASLGGRGGLGRKKTQRAREEESSGEEVGLGVTAEKEGSEEKDGFPNSTEVQRVKNSELSAANEGAEYLYAGSSAFTTSNCNLSSETTNTDPAEESQTSHDELALDTYEKPKASNKRRNRASEKVISKVPRKRDGRSGRGRSKR